jgi:ankyrin repeat protein
MRISISISGMQNGCTILLTAILLIVRHPTTAFTLYDFLVGQAISICTPKVTSGCRRVALASTGEITLPFSVHETNEVEEETTTDNRPHEQRTKGPRQARRLNHSFRYLYRNASHFYRDVTASEFLAQYYTSSEILEMNQTFPPLLDLDVARHLHPKVRFLQETLHMDRDDSEAMRRARIPPQYFGARLERTIAPRHAFLVHMGLPHGSALFRDDTPVRAFTENDVPNNRFTDFLLSCRQTKRFCALCKEWKREQQQEQASPDRGHQQTTPITSRQIEAFDSLFSRGLLAAARNDLVQWNNTWPLDHINVSSSEILRLMVQHGANPLERDNRGTTLLHWAAGTGNLDALRELLPYFPNGPAETTERDGATPLHWGAAGSNSKEFGTGGHAHVCQHLLSQCDSGNAPCSARELVNQRTYDGNSPLMWAAWSGSLDTVKLLVRRRAEWDVANRNGCTVAHWAASGGSLEVCKYLAEVVNVNFFEPNHGGNTPLTHAVAFGRADVVRYIRELAESTGNGGGDEAAARLAADFVGWGGADTKRRKQVLQLLQNDYWDLPIDEGSSGASGENGGMLSIDQAQGIELEEY